jgi:hypothetical protein
MLIYSLREYIDTKSLVRADFEHPSSPPPPAKKQIGLLSASGIHTQAY